MGTRQLSVKKGRSGMDKYQCRLCPYIYDPAKGDPENGQPAGTSFEKLPEDWLCPICGAPKSEFEKI
jgi:rubredoxin